MPKIQNLKATLLDITMIIVHYSRKWNGVPAKLDFFVCSIIFIIVTIICFLAKLLKLKLKLKKYPQKFKTADTFNHDFSQNISRTKQHLTKLQKVSPMIFKTFLQMEQTNVLLPYLFIYAFVGLTFDPSTFHFSSGIFLFITNWSLWQWYRRLNCLSWTSQISYRGEFSFWEIRQGM
jgi:hypothetical protein